MPTRLHKPGQLRVGEFYEDCAFHPCLCVSVEAAGVLIEGVSLVSGSISRCNIRHCGLRKLSPDEAIAWRLSGPGDVEIEPESRWWE